MSESLVRGSLASHSGPESCVYGNPFFTRDLARGYWTSTTEAFYPAFAIVVYMDEGQTRTSTKAEHHSIWAVRDTTIFIDGFESGDTSAWRTVVN